MEKIKVIAKDGVKVEKPRKPPPPVEYYSDSSPEEVPATQTVRRLITQGKLIDIAAAAQIKKLEENAAKKSSDTNKGQGNEKTKSYCPERTSAG